MKEIRIVNARQKDIEQVVELWKDFVDYHASLHPFYKRSKNALGASRKYFLKTIGSPVRQLFVAIDGKTVVGFALAEVGKYPPVFIHKKYGMIIDLYVDPAYRRHGLGRTLYLKMKEWFARRGLTRIELTVAAANKTAWTFWKKMGFQERSRRMAQDL